MKIWRIQNEAGIGPYISGSPVSNMLYDPTNHPDPRHDIPNWKRIKNPKKYKYGFSDIQTLRWWFDDRSLINLYKENFRIVCVSVPKRNTKVGTRQIAFVNDKARVVQTLESINLNSDTLV